MIVGFVGLGRMGGHMCRNVARNSGHEVLVFDLSEGAVRACTDVGGVAAEGLAHLCERADVIFSSLPTPDDVERVALGPGGIVQRARPGTVYIDLSTNSPEVARRVASELNEAGIAMLDAPVSGGPAGAEAGTLTIMVGGDAEELEAHRALLGCIGSNVIHVGPLGSGLVAKLVNNMLGLVSVAAAAEGMMLAAEAGVDLRKLDQVIRCSSGDSVAYRSTAEHALSGDYTASFALDLAYKDVHLALELADQLSVPTPAGCAAHNLMRMARGSGFGDLDPTAVVKVYEVTMRRELVDGVAEAV